MAQAPVVGAAPPPKKAERASVAPYITYGSALLVTGGALAAVSIVTFVVPW